MEKETVTLREYIDVKISALDRATVLAAQQMERRLEGMNEFRTQLKDQAAGFVSKDELNRVELGIVDLRETRSSSTAILNNVEHRMETLNALRGEVLKDREMYLDKALYSQMHQALMDRVTKLESQQARMTGVGVAMVALSGLIGIVISHLLSK